MPASIPPARSRLNGLDGLRFLAAMAVVAYHYTGVRTTFWGTAPSEVFPALNQVSRYGWIGVELFFVISGFVILMTAYGRPVEKFTASRVARLFPAYWAAIVLTFVLQMLWDDGRQPSPVEYLLNLTMVQEAFDVTNVQGAFWTLWWELKFYLLIGVFILVGITRRRVIAFAVLWPLIGSLADATNTHLLESLLIPRYAPYFAVGMLLFLVHREGSSAVLWLGIGFTGILCVHEGVGYAGRASELTGQPVSGPVVGGLVVVVIASVWALTSGPLARVSWGWLTTLGLLTYPLYLVHGQFGFFVIDQMHGRAPAYVVLATAVVVSLVLAVLIHYGIERRFHDPLRDSVLRGLVDTKDLRPAGGRAKDAPAGSPEEAPSESAEGASPDDGAPDLEVTPASPPGGAARPTTV